MKYILMQFFLIVSIVGISQISSIEGTIVDSEGVPKPNIQVTMQPGDYTTITNAEGFFKFDNISAGEYSITYGGVSLEPVIVKLEEGEQKVLPSISQSTAILSADVFNNLDVLETADETSSVSSLLTASRDVFMNKAGFQFGSDVFFRIRGYDTRYSDFMVNGVRLENPETGWQPFNLVGGLNDILRYRDIETIGTNSMDNGIGEVGGARNYNLRPSEYGNGGRVTYSNLNRSYNHRVMATYASGENPSGWSFVASGSKRWAQEPYVEGNYYDATAGYLAVEKKVSDKYSVMASGMWSPRRRATHTIHRQEVYDLMGTNYFSADWGYQDGEKRNSRLRKNSNPVIMLANYLTISPNTTAQITGSYITGEQRNSRIQRQLGYSNPDPDYYRNLPSYAENYPDEASFTPETAPFLLNPQLDWVNFYRVNTANGGESGFILEDNVREDTEIQAVAQFQTKLNDNISLNYGGNYKKFTGNYYRQVNDLLGGQYYMDVENVFVDDNFPGSVDGVYAFKNDLTNIDDRVYEGDIYGFNYDLNKEEADAYIQANFSYDQLDFFLSGSIGQSNYWRVGNMQNEQFDDNSVGKGEVVDFLTYGAKAGATYKLNGRNYISANGMFYQKPPLLTTVWQAATTRNSIHPLTDEEQIYSGELNYNYKSPNLTVRATGYATRFDNQAESLLAFSDTGNVNDQGDEITNDFGFFYTHGIDKLHYGGEFGFDYKINPDLSLSGAAALGKYTFMSRPLVSAYSQAPNFQNGSTGLTEAAILPVQSAFMLDFYEDNTPQTATNLGLTWRGPKRFIMNLDGNYYNDTYSGASPFRRTAQVASIFEPIDGLTDEETIAYYTKQERLPDAFRLNFSLYKEIRFSYNKQIGINLAVNNILDDQDYANLAFENVRVQDLNNSQTINPNDFPTRLRYATGRTYFLNIAYKFR